MEAATATFNIDHVFNSRRCCTSELWKPLSSCSWHLETSDLRLTFGSPMGFERGVSLMFEKITRDRLRLKCYGVSSAQGNNVSLSSEDFLQFQVSTEVLKESRCYKETRRRSDMEFKELKRSLGLPDYSDCFNDTKMEWSADILQYQVSTEVLKESKCYKEASHLSDIQLKDLKRRLGLPDHSECISAITGAVCKDASIGDFGGAFLRRSHKD